MAAPFIPSEFSKNSICPLGTRRIFKSIFKISAKEISKRITFDFPTIEIRLFEITKREPINEPIESILNAFSARRYSEPNRIFIITPGKRNIKRNMGKLIMKIHFPTCLLNSLMLWSLLLVYSLIIIGKNNCKNISGANKRSIEIGAAELYNPTISGDLKYPIEKESTQKNTE